MDPVDEWQRDVQVVELGHQVALDGIEGRTEVNKEESAEVAGCFQVLEEGVEETCVLCPSPGLVGELIGIQLWADNRAPPSGS